jgi:hypothetical protein
VRLDLVGRFDRPRQLQGKLRVGERHTGFSERPVADCVEAVESEALAGDAPLRESRRDLARERARVLRREGAGSEGVPGSSRPRLAPPPEKADRRRVLP